MLKDESTQKDKGGRKENTKKPYTTPRLIIHGDIKRITHGGGAGNEDLDLTGNLTSGGI